jgi:hypothetical protein
MRSGAASLAGTARGSNEPPVADPDAGEHRGVPLRVDGTSCKGMPRPLNRIVESADEVGDLTMIVNMIRAAALLRREPRWVWM